MLYASRIKPRKGNTMANLNANMFYKTKFAISRIDSQEDLLWKIVLHIRQWQVAKCKRKGVNIPAIKSDWTRVKNGYQLVSTADSAYKVCIQSDYFSPDSAKLPQYWACRVFEDLTPKEGHAPRQWVTEIGYEQEEENTAILSCVLSYTDRAGFIGPYMEAPSPSVPNLIRNITNDRSLHSFCGPDILSEKPCELNVGGWPAFLEQITNPDRQLPYIYISPKMDNEETGGISFLIDPDSLAKTLFGNAVVFYSKDLDFSREMQYMNDEYACYGGALRVYMPGVLDSHKHRYLSAADIYEMGEDVVIGFLYRAFAQNVNFYDKFFTNENCRKKREEFYRARHLMQMRQEYQSKLNQTQKLSIDMLMDEAEHRELAEELVREQEKQIEDLKQRNYELTCQVDQNRVAVEDNRNLKKALDARFSTESLPNTKEKVVEYFSKHFGDRLAFSDDAINSLKGCTLAPEEIWRVCFALANTMRDLYTEGSGEIYSIFRRKTGLDAARGEGRMTRKNPELMRQFQTKWNGETIDIEPHITYSSQKQSIHFGYSEKYKKVVIGHCGEHKENYSTRHVH